MKSNNQYNRIPVAAFLALFFLMVPLQGVWGYDQASYYSQTYYQSYYQGYYQSYYQSSYAAGTTGSLPTATPVVGNVTTNTETAATSITITKPSGLSDGDVLIACVSNGDNSTITDPAGWVQVLQSNTTAGDNISTYVGYKIITDASAEGASYTFDIGATPYQISGVIMAVSNLAPYEVFLVEDSTVSTGENYSGDPAPAVTTDQVQGFLVNCIGLTSNNVTSFTPPSGSTEQADITNSDAKLSMATRVISNPGSTGTQYFNVVGDNGSEEWHANSVMFRTREFATVSGSTYLGSTVALSGAGSVTDNISKGSGTFVIDHPLDPANKLLYHSFVESPEAKNVYDGIATLDGNGEATVVLPDYFEALNKDYRYQVKGLTDPAPSLHIKEEIKNNQFVIGGGPAYGEISWQVTGVRQDPYMIANPIVVEVEKGPDALRDKGEYLFAGYAYGSGGPSSNLLVQIFDWFKSLIISVIGWF